MADAESRRAYVIMDRFAAIQQARALRLSPTEYVVMDVLLRVADFRSHTWIGSAVDLAGDVRTSPATVRATLRRFEALGLVEMREPFRQHAKAEVFIKVYDDLVIPPRGRAPSPSLTAIPRNDTKPQVSDSEKADRGALADYSEPIAYRFDDDSGWSPETTLDPPPLECVYCGEPADGKAKEGKQACCWRHEEF